MLLIGQHRTRTCQGPTRRALRHAGALSVVGLSLPDLFRLRVSGAPLNGNGTVPELDSALPGSAGGFPAGGPTTAIMPEVTLDATPVYISQQVQVQRNVYKGGALKFSFLLKGYEVMRDWCVFLAGCDANGTLFLSNGNVYSGGGPGYSIPGLVPAGGVPGMAGVPGQGR